ncbi:MAG: hypothetical protein JW719_02340 [Pirellulales bacterium]|nr:hypothetical protein [Pirellulales bacterium]
MNHRSLSLVVLVAALVGLAFAACGASAATCTLEPKKLDSGQRIYRPRSSTPDWLFQFTEPQRISVHLQPRVVEKDGEKETIWVNPQPWRDREFNDAVAKQPKKYNAKTPLRGMFTLGDKKYGFVLDAPDAKSQTYGLLHFDLNGNGDLTDDAVMESTQARQDREAREAAEKEKKEKAETDADDEKSAKEADGEKAKKKAQAKKRAAKLRAARSAYGQFSFPPIEMKIEIDGKPVDYRFFISGYSYLRSNYGNVNVTLAPGLYYEGQIELNGRGQRVVLVDYNGNGRFDDHTGIQEVRYSEKGPARFHPQRGDVLFLDPKPVNNHSAVWDVMGLDFRHNVEKLLCLGGKFYHLKVAPAGNELTIEPAEVAVGYVKNPNAGYSAILHGELGLLRVSGTADQPVAVPEGEWKMVSYKIDLTESRAEEEKKKEEAQKAADKAKAAAEKAENKKPSLLTAIGKAASETAVGRRAATAPVRSRAARKTTLVSAMGTTDGKPVKVVKDETVLLPFGPPYRTVAEPSYFQQANDTLHLGLGIYGSGGEAVTDLRVDGGRPPKPTIKILDPDDKVVNEGNFEYG